MRPIPAPVRRSATLALILAVLAAVPVLGQSAEAKPPLDEASWSLFQRIFGMVLRDYVDPKAPDEVILGALKGAASSAGPECAYIPPGEVAAYRALDRAPSVLPVYVTKENDFAKVLASYPGQDPTIRPGDALRFIGDRSTYDLTYPQVLEAMHGTPGEKVRCIFIKQESWQSYTVTLTRQAPAPPRWLPLGNGSGALVLPCLEAPLPPEVSRALAGAKGPVVVDLRGCAADDARAALRWAGDLLGKAEGPARKGPKGVVRDPLAGPGLLAGKVTRVLVSETTARGGEVLALALAGGGALLAGGPTFGWAPYSQDFPLENGGLLRLNTAYFLAPQGEALDGHPMPPAIPLTFAEGAKPEEVYLQTLKAQLPSPKPAAEKGDKAQPSPASGGLKDHGR